MRRAILVCALLALGGSGCAGLIGLDDKQDAPPNDGAGGTFSTGGTTATGGTHAAGGTTSIGGTGGHAGNGGSQGGSSGNAGSPAGGASQGGHGGTPLGGHGGTAGTSGGSAGNAGIGGASGGPAGGHGGTVAGGNGGSAGQGGGVGGAAGGVGGSMGGVGGSTGGVGGDSGGVGGDSGGVGGDGGGVGGDSGGVGGDSGGAGGDAGGTGGMKPVATIVFSYQFADNTLTDDQKNNIYRFDPDAGGLPESISDKLDTQLPVGGDYNVNISHNGEWIVFTTGRSPCSAFQPCIGVAHNDATLSGATLIRHKIQFTTEYVDSWLYARPAITNDGTTVIFNGFASDMSIQLFSRTRTGQTGTFTGGIPLTNVAEGNHSGSINPSLSLDDQTVFYECAAAGTTQPNEGTGTGICSVLVADGSGFADVLKPEEMAGPSPSMNGAGHPSQHPKGDLLFTGSPTSMYSLVWHKLPDKSLEILSNANSLIESSPCAFPDGRIAFLGRALDGAMFPKGIGIRLAPSNDPDLFEGAPTWPVLPPGTNPDSFNVDGWIGCGLKQ